MVPHTPTTQLLPRATYNPLLHWGGPYVPFVNDSIRPQGLGTTKATAKDKFVFLPTVSSIAAVLVTSSHKAHHTHTQRTPLIPSGQLKSTGPELEASLESHMHTRPSTWALVTITHRGPRGTK